MTKDDVQPNARMINVLERMYSLSCEKPDISVSSSQFNFFLLKFFYFAADQCKFSPHHSPLTRRKGRRLKRQL